MNKYANYHIPKHIPKPLERTPPEAPEPVEHVKQTGKVKQRNRNLSKHRSDSYCRLGYEEIFQKSCNCFILNLYVTRSSQ